MRRRCSEKKIQSLKRLERNYYGTIIIHFRHSLSPACENRKKSCANNQYQFVSMDGFVHFLHQVIRGGSMFKRPINGPSLRATMDRGSRGEAKTRPRSIRPFICHRPPKLLADPHRRQSAQEESRERGVVSGGGEVVQPSK